MSAWQHLLLPKVDHTTHYCSHDLTQFYVINFFKCIKQFRFMAAVAIGLSDLVKGTAFKYQWCLCIQNIPEMISKFPEKLIAAILINTFVKKNRKSTFQVWFVPLLSSLKIFRFWTINKAKQVQDNKTSPWDQGKCFHGFMASFDAMRLFWLQRQWPKHNIAEWVSPVSLFFPVQNYNHHWNNPLVN